MKHATQTQFGRSVRAVYSKDVACDGVDKWEALAALTDAAEAYGVNHRTLGVLKALMTFLRPRHIDPEPGGAIVFPSNRTLSNRLNGMPDSTLRRHLAKLVSIGIVSRHDSPNRKRYARGLGQDTQIAFGFDLSPIARHFDMVTQQAQEVRDAREHMQALRARLGQLRHRLLEHAGQGPLDEQARQELRRKPNASKLDELCTALEAAIEDIPPAQMNTTDGQNERHIQYVNKYISDSEEPMDHPNVKKTNDIPAETTGNTENDLRHILNLCPEFQSYFPNSVRRWHDLIVVASNLAPMIGIDRPVFTEAMKVMGHRKAATVLVCMLENISTIQSPGAYLRKLTQSAKVGGFSAQPMLQALSKRVKTRELSADNLLKC